MRLNRLSYLDSARGIASLMVLFSHFLGAFTMPQILNVLNGTFFHVLWDGKIAVSFFFVLSGFVLSRIYFIDNNSFNEFNYISFIIKRIFRIYPVYFIVLFFSFFSVKYIYNFNLIESLSVSTKWIKTFWIEKYSLISTLKESILIIRLPQEPEKRLINQDWTLTIEILVSLLIPVFITIVKKNRNWLLITALLLLRLHTLNWIVEFILGVYISISLDDFKKIITPKMLIFLFVSAFLLISVRYYFLLSELIDIILIKTISFLLLVLVLFSSNLQNILNTKLNVFIGKISYSLYLVHFLVLLIVSPVLFKFLYNLGIFIDTMIYFIVLFFVLIISIFLAYILHRFIEKPIYKSSIRIITFYNQIFSR